MVPPEDKVCGYDCQRKWELRRYSRECLMAAILIAVGRQWRGLMVVS